MNNLKTSPCKFLLALIAIIALASTTSFARIKLDQQQKNENNDEDNEQNHAIYENNFKVPFVVLMSSHEISVAQLPLIGYGNVSAVYRLDDDHDGAESVHDISLTPPTSKKSPEKKIADAREYEQMHKSSSTSLGKSERQQIAAGSGESSYLSHDREEVGKRRNEDVPTRDAEVSGQKAEADAEGPTTVPRKKRSNSDASITNSGVAYAGNSLLASSDGTSNNKRDTNSSNSRSSVQESSFSANVTSARTRNEQEEVVRRGRAEDDEPKNGDAVQFSDFDVHMRLGLIFVADSRGRIHRFKLSGYEDGGSQAENDYTNSIGTGFDDSARSKPASEASSMAAPQPNNIRNFAQSDATSFDNGRAFGFHNFSAHGAGDNDDGRSLTDSDDANKVGLFSVASENFGRHPTTSGAEQSGKFGYAESGNDVSPATSGSEAGSSSFETNYDVSILRAMQRLKFDVAQSNLHELSFDF